MAVVLELEKVRRTFRQGGRDLKVLRGVSLKVESGEIVGLLGPSGAGKSTLLHIAGLLERPDEGSIRIEGRDCANLSDAERTLVRRHGIGFVYQFHHLLPEFTALENVILPQRIGGSGDAKAAERARDILARMGLKERLDHLPSELSGGEQQRVAISRALVGEPALLLADEPTGNLDEATALKVFDELLAAVRGTGTGALIATHNLALAEMMDRCVHLHEGKVQKGPA